MTIQTIAMHRWLSYRDLNNNGSCFQALFLFILVPATVMLPAHKEQKGPFPFFSVAFRLIGNTHMSGSCRQGDKLI